MMPANRLRPSARRGGVLGGLFMVLLVLAAAAVLAWMLLLPRGAAHLLQQRSGFPTQMERLALNPFTGRFSGAEWVIHNPAAFGGGVLARARRFEGRVEPMSLTRAEAVIEELTLDLDSLVLVVDAEGRTNTDALGAALRSGLVAAADPLQPTYATAGWADLPAGPSSLVVRRLNLRLGHLEVVNLAGASPRRVGEQIDFGHTYADVRSFEQLIGPELLQALLKSPPLLEALVSSGVVPGLERGNNPLQQLMQQAGEAMNSLFRKLEQSGKP